mgnify:CR=1 FL=1
MAIVLALLIVGWLVAFALGAQSGFDTQVETAAPVASASSTEDTAGYREPASVA